MKRFLGTTLRSGTPFGLIAIVLFSIEMGLPVGLLAGTIAGLLFGLAMATFLAIQRRRFQADPPQWTEETLLWDGPANHFYRAESVGGWLYLTTRRLLFRSHPVNLQRHELELPLADVVEAAAVNTAWLIPNGLLVSTAAGNKERFVVEQRKRWRTEIARAKSGLPKTVQPPLP